MIRIDWSKPLKKYQFINWFPEWQGFGLCRFTTKDSLLGVYKWMFAFGFWELRRWQDKEKVKGIVEEINREQARQLKEVKDG